MYPALAILAHIEGLTGCSPFSACPPLEMDCGSAWRCVYGNWLWVLGGGGVLAAVLPWGRRMSLVCRWPADVPSVVDLQTATNTHGCTFEYLTMTTFSVTVGSVFYANLHWNKSLFWRVTYCLRSPICTLTACHGWHRKKHREESLTTS